MSDKVSQSQPEVDARSQGQVVHEKLANNIVAESDLRGALLALDSFLNTANCSIEKAVDENGAVGKLPPNVLEQSQSSFKSNLQRVVSSVADENYFNRFVVREVADEVIMSDDDDSDCERTDTEENDFEYDEEELLDIEAVKRAEELRSQMRTASEKVGKLRGAVVSKALSLSAREIGLLVGRQNREDNVDVDHLVESLWEPKFEGEAQQKQRQELEDAFRALRLQLGSVQQELPPKQEQIQTTLQAVREGLERERNESRTELAIRSQLMQRTDGSARNDCVEMSAEERLASIFAAL